MYERIIGASLRWPVAPGLCDDQGNQALIRFSFLSNARRRAVQLAALALGAATLSGCAYGYGDYGGYGGVSVGVGNGFAGGYDPYCDGFSAWDSFYGCDYGYGFGQIGFGGGYWDNFYYPGYGLWLFDRPGGRRFAMQDRHRQYWGQQRWQYQQQRRGNRQDFRQGRRDDRQDLRRERRDDRQDFRQDRRQDRRDWRQGQPGQLDPAERQQRREMRQQRRQDMIGQPQQPGQPRGQWQGRGDGQGRGEWQGRGWGGDGQGRGRPMMQQPQPQAVPQVAQPRMERALRPERQPRMERTERPQGQPRVDRAPRGNPATIRRSGVRQQDVRED